MSELVAFRRSFALFADEWPTNISMWLANELTMSVGSHERPIVVSYLQHGLSQRQREDVRTFLMNRPQRQVHVWLAEVITRLHTKELTTEWLKAQEFNIDLEALCQVKIECIFNFPCEDPIIRPTEKYPLGFIMTSL